jgi:hypothetical protein
MRATMTLPMVSAAHSMWGLSAECHDSKLGHYPSNGRGEDRKPQLLASPHPIALCVKSDPRRRTRLNMDAI